MDNFVALLWEVFLDFEIGQQKSPELYHRLDVVDADFRMALLEVLVWLEELDKFDDEPE